MVYQVTESNILPLLVSLQTSMENSNQIPITKPRNLKRKQLSKPSISASFTFQETVDVIETDSLVTQKIFKYLSSLPSGYRFKPNDVELIRDYLRPKIANQRLPPCLIHPVKLYGFHPKTLAEKYLKHPDGDELYFFTPRDRKYKNGSRPSRGVNGVGYWKATGSEVKIMLGDEIIGYVRTLTFYEGSPKTGKKSNWIMHEYRTCESRKRTSNEDMKLDGWILCKIREKEETGPSKNKNKSKNKNEEANVNSSRSDTDTENALTDVNAAKDDNVISTDCDEEDNVITDYDEEDNLLNPNYCTTCLNEDDKSLNPKCCGTSCLNEDDKSLNPKCCGTSCLNEDDKSLNPNYCITSYCNERYQPNQDMGLPWPHCSSYLFDTSQEDFNMINDNCISGGLPDELIYVPGPNFANQLLRDGAEFYGQWESDMNIMCNNGLDCWSTCYEDSYDFQESNSGLQINDADDKKQMKLEKR